jgi:type III pantothenate kinase
MKLLVDIGNSRVKWAVMDKDGLAESHDFQRSKTGIKASLNKVWKPLKNVEAVFVANVAGDKLGQQLTEWTEKQWQLTPTFVSSEAKRFGVSNAYDEPQQLGIDRWLSLIAARQHARQAQCVIDCGTAMTIDIVSKSGQHQGGMILPGLSLMRSSLATNTDALTEAPGEKEFKTLATNTFSAIQAGTLYSVSATLERIIADLRQSFKNQVRFIITGGDAPQLLPLLPDDVYHYPDIVLKGLAFYVRQDERKTRSAKKAEKTAQNEKSTAESEPQADNHAASAQEQQTNDKPAASKAKPRRGRPRKSQNDTQSEQRNTENPDTALPEQAI